VAPVLQAGKLRSPRIEATRAVAALSVLVGHVWLFSHLYGSSAYASLPRRLLAGGGLGVMLFFALSGYLIYRPFARRDFADGGPVSIGTYARNRALRILPVYWVAVVFLLLVTQHGGSANQWWRFLTLSESFSTTTAQTVDGPMWSLVVEVHFYLLLPFLAWALARLGGRRPAVAVGVLIVLGAASAWFRHLNPAPVYIWQYSLPATFYGFVPGMALALVQPRLDAARPGWWRGPAFRRDVWLGVGVAGWVAVCQWLQWEAPVIAVGTFFFVGALVLPLEEGLLVRLLDLRVLALVGVASYSLYLWHVPMIERVWEQHDIRISFSALLFETLPAALVVAGLSYALVERPALSLRGRWFFR
jgi:peptidoglycan/LPS O-acetylase OafA/YrhL